jgi:hypothetical protein
MPASLYITICRGVLRIANAPHGLGAGDHAEADQWIHRAEERGIGLQHVADIDREQRAKTTDSEHAVDMAIITKEITEWLMIWDAWNHNATPGRLNLTCRGMRVIRLIDVTRDFTGSKGRARVRDC